MRQSLTNHPPGGDKRGAVEGSYFLLLLGLAKDLTQRKPM